MLLFVACDPFLEELEEDLLELLDLITPFIPSLDCLAQVFSGLCSRLGALSHQTSLSTRQLALLLIHELSDLVMIDMSIGVGGQAIVKKSFGDTVWELSLILFSNG